MGSLPILVDWTNHIPCDRTHVVPLLARPRFRDYTTFDMATRLGRLPADPTDYTDLEGGLYYRTSTQRLYFRDGTNWKPLGLGDGDVIFDPVGTAQQDNGVARWSSTSKYVQGSVATLSDIGDFSTPGVYVSNNELSTNYALWARNSATSTAFSIDHAGRLAWVSGSAEQAYLALLSSNVLGSAKTDMSFKLTAGDSRIAAQRFLGGKGNAQGNSNFRCPVVSQTIPAWHFPGDAGTGEHEIFSEVIPINGLAPGDLLHIKLLLQTAGTDESKIVKFYIGGNGSSDRISIGSAGSATPYFCHVDFWLMRSTDGGIVSEVTGTQQGAFMGTIDPHNYTTAIDLGTQSLTIYVAGSCTLGTAPYPVDAFIVNGGVVEYFCY